VNKILIFTNQTRPKCFELKNEVGTAVWLIEQAGRNL